MPVLVIVTLLVLILLRYLQWL